MAERLGLQLFLISPPISSQLPLAKWRTSLACGRARADCCRSRSTSTRRRSTRRSPALQAFAGFLPVRTACSLLAVREAWPRMPRDSHVVDIVKPTMVEQRDAWQKIVAPSGDRQLRRCWRASSTSTSSTSTTSPRTQDRPKRKPARRVPTALGRMSRARPPHALTRSRNGSSRRHASTISFCRPSKPTCFARSPRRSTSAARSTANGDLPPG